MNKKLLTLLLCVISMLTASIAGAQNVTWKHSVKHLENDIYQIVFEASIPEGFHMYDTSDYGPTGPTGTKFEFTPGQDVSLIDSIEMLTQPHKYYDEIYKMEIGTLEKKARFAQKVKVGAAKETIKTYIEWMICNDGSCMPPDDTEITIELSNADAPVKSDSSTNSSLWGLIIEAILWGFAALLTPCVFPMVPMTVSFFMKGSSNPVQGRFRASMYGLFIVALYTLPIAVIILITKFVGGDSVTADIFNWLATHWLPNILFFIVFMVFAASFFGAFEITLPSSIINKSDSKSDSKGLGGVFFMALTLVLVSFSCTGPIVGSVLIKSTSGEFWSPIITMLAFSIAFSLPFTLLAFFPSLLKKMPKSGGWLNSVKVVLGFIEIALGFKFLSVADQTYHWGLLDREIYLAIWIVCFSLLGLYLLGKIRFENDSEVKHLTVGRLALSITVFAFVVYMIPGMWGAPLKGLSGYLPPIQSQDFVLGQYTPASQPAVSYNVTPGQRKYSDFLQLPHKLDGFFDLKEAQEYAAKVGKPLFIDFTGHGCVNCRNMEIQVWSDPQVLELLRNEYVIVALYCDDKKVLPESEWITTESGKVLKSLGKINSHYAITTFGVNAQPYYVIQDSKGNTLTEPRGYNLSIEGFVDFLKNGIAAYKK